MSKNIFIGADGGGTKTKIRIEDEKGKLIGQAISGPSNIRLSVEQAWDSILSGVQTALKESKLTLDDLDADFHLGLGLAGCEVPEAREAFLGTKHPFRTMILQKDSYTACLGAHDGADGAIIIVGTGVVGLKIQEHQVYQVGGWGFPHSDEGGGAWLGLEAMRLTLQTRDGRAQGSPLTKAIFKRFDNNLDQMVTWACEAVSTEFAQLVPLVTDYLEKQDKQAIHLIKTAAHEIDLIYKALEKQGPKAAKMPYCLFGGVAPFLEPWLSTSLKKQIVPRKNDAAHGALLLVRRSVFAGQETTPLAHRLNSMLLFPDA